MMGFESALVGVVPLLAFVLALVEWVKKLGVVPPSWYPVVSMVMGALCGIGYKLSLGVITEFAGWFEAIVYGLALGLIASGVYDAAKSATR